MPKGINLCDVNQHCFVSSFSCDPSLAIFMSEKNEVFLSLPFLRARDPHGAFLDHWVNCFGVFKFGVIGAEIYHGNTRLQDMHLVLG